VYENSTDNTVVDYGSWDGDPSDRILTLDSTLEMFFDLVGDELIVENGMLITRDVQISPYAKGQIVGEVACQKKSSGLVVNERLSIPIVNINTLNPIIFENTNSEEVVPENKDTNEEIILVTATDADVSIKDYTITSQIPDEGIFDINTISGQKASVFLTKDLDYENCKSYILTIRATSEGFDNEGKVANQENTIVITINVDDVNDNDPEFSSCSASGLPPIYSAIVSRDAAVGDVVDISPCAIEAKDPDTGINSPITYALIPEDGQDYFEIDSNGVISLSKSLETLDDSVEFMPIYVRATEDIGGRSTVTYATVSTSGDSDVNIVQGVDETLFYALVGALGGLALLLLVLLIYACCRRNPKELSEAADILSLHSSQNGFTNDVTIEDETATGQETTSLDGEEEEKDESEEGENKEDNKDGEEDKEEEKDEEEPKEDETVEEKQEEEEKEEDEEEGANLYETVVDVAPAAAVATAAVVTFAADVKDTDSVKSDDDDNKDETPAN